MLIGDRLRALREAKKLSQKDIAKRSGLAQTHISAIENDHMIPLVRSLEKIARAVGVPLYELFYDGEKVSKSLGLSKPGTGEKTRWGSTGKQARALSKFWRLLARMDERDRELLLHVAQKMARR